jgi:hypothetical protein
MGKYDIPNTFILKMSYITTKLIIKIMVHDLSTKTG